MPRFRSQIMEDLLWSEEPVECVVSKKGRAVQSLDDDDQHAQMITVSHWDIPSFLHDSAFYKALSDGDTSDDIIIPNMYFSATHEVNNESELLHMLDVMSFWGANTIPDGVIEFCQYCYHWDRDRIRNILSNVLDEVGLLSELKEIFCADLPLMRAIRVGRTEVVKYLAQNRTSCSNPKIVALAAFLGDISYLKILHQNGYEWYSSACASAASNGHLNCLQYLHENGCEWDFTVYICAAVGNHWDCFMYAIANGLSFVGAILSVLVQRELTPFLQCAIDHGCNLTDFAVEQAAQGYTESLRTMLHASCPMPIKACVVAAEGGHIECLRLLHVHGAVLNEKVTAAAAMGGSLSCLEYLHEQGCPWNEETTCEAAKHSKLSTLQYAIENNCPYIDILVEIAASSSGIACLQYLVEDQGMFIGGSMTLACAVKSCNPVVVQYLIDQGCDIHSSTNSDLVWYRHSLLKMQTQIDKPLLECIKIASAYGWDLQVQLPSLLCAVVASSSEVPLLYTYLLEEGHLH